MSLLTFTVQTVKVSTGPYYKSTGFLKKFFRAWRVPENKRSSKLHKLVPERLECVLALLICMSTCELFTLHYITIHTLHSFDALQFFLNAYLSVLSLLLSWFHVIVNFVHLW